MLLQQTADSDLFVVANNPGSDESIGGITFQDMFIEYTVPSTNNPPSSAIRVGNSPPWVARLQIREFFTARAEARGLVTTGIYSKIRNPIYVSNVFLFVGMMLYLSMPLWSLVFLLMIMILQIWRAKNEARVLEAKFGDAYRGYRSKTWF